jgi:hypothetical protein
VTGYFKSHLAKKNQSTGFLWASILLFTLIIFATSASGKTKMEYKYLLSVNTHRSLCVIRLNELIAMENVYSRSGTESSGQNITAFLENGNNTLSISMGKKAIDKDFEKFNPDSWCEAIIRKASAHDQGQIVSYIKLSVDKNGDIVTHASPNSISNNSSDFDFLGMSKNYGKKKIISG